MSKIILFSKRVFRILIGITVVTVASAGYVIAFDKKTELNEVLNQKYENNFVLQRDAFVCTKVEQKSKNLDDVTCVQYTNIKHHQEAIELNKSIVK